MKRNEMRLRDVKALMRQTDQVCSEDNICLDTNFEINSLPAFNESQKLNQKSLRTTQ